MDATPFNGESAFGEERHKKFHKSSKLPSSSSKEDINFTMITAALMDLSRKRDQSGGSTDTDSTMYRHPESGYGVSTRESSNTSSHTPTRTSSPSSLSFPLQRQLTPAYTREDDRDDKQILNQVSKDLQYNNVHSKSFSGGRGMVPLSGKEVRQDKLMHTKAKKAVNHQSSKPKSFSSETHDYVSYQETPSPRQSRFFRRTYNGSYDYNKNRYFYYPAHYDAYVGHYNTPTTLDHERAYRSYSHERPAYYHNSSDTRYLNCYERNTSAPDWMPPPVNSSKKHAVVSYNKRANTDSWSTHERHSGFQDKYNHTRDITSRPSTVVANSSYTGRFAEESSPSLHIITEEEKSSSNETKTARENTDKNFTKSSTKLSDNRPTMVPVEYDGSNEHMKAVPSEIIVTTPANITPKSENSVSSDQSTEADEKLTESTSKSSKKRPENPAGSLLPADSPIPTQNKKPKMEKNADFGLLDMLCSATLKVGHIAPSLPSKSNSAAAVASLGCSCPKSKCIKLYCDCFQAGKQCDPRLCACASCKNTAMESGESGARTKAIRNILSRNPHAFQDRSKRIVPPTGALTCKCVKSQCLKLYCDCFQAGSVCQDFCACIKCLNTIQESGPSGLRTLAMDACLERKPKAFAKKVKQIGTGCACKHNR
eukprot:scaffold55258_cov50-Attheya_sp.AAC.2